jgi:N-acetylmuramoyl-L-alanine amidase
LTNQRASKVLIPLFASLLAVSPLSFSAVPRTRRDRATEAFSRAEALHAKLAATPEKDRTTSDYRVLILAYHSVYRLDPGYGKAPVSLNDIGDLYREMGRVFSQPRYFTDAIQAYQFVMKEYPYSSFAREGPLSLADVYLTDLHQPEKARDQVQAFLDKYPHSEKADDARARLAVIERTLEANRAPAPPPATTVTSVAPDSVAVSGGVPQVTDIRHWVGPHYTRIVIGLSGGEAKFDTMRLSHPDRIVLDLQNTHLSKALAGAKFPVEDGFLKQVRVGQYKPDVTRVVLDVEKVQDFFVFPLPNPFRLVVDVHGPPGEAPVKTEVAKSASAPPASASQSVTDVAAAKATAAEATARQEPATNRERTKVAEAAPEVPPIPVKGAEPTAAGDRTLTRALGLKIGKIVIDPGHGGHDTGTIGPTGLEEKNVVLDVALRLAKILREETSSQVILTRSTDVFIPLEERTAIANEKGADLFISIHANSSRDRAARGIETYYMNFTSDPGALAVAARENATSQESVHELRDLIKKIALTEKVEESRDFAIQVQRALYRRVEKATGQQKDRGVKKAPFVVLIGANMPSILAEISFLSNPRDERLLKRSEYREKIAEALAHGIIDYGQSLGGIKVAQRGSSFSH